MNNRLRGERTVAGIRCREVLADLSAYLDGELADDKRTRIEAHVTGCDACTQMGAEVGALIVALRERVGAAAMPEDAAARLDDAMRRL